MRRQKAEMCRQETGKPQAKAKKSSASKNSSVKRHLKDAPHRPVPFMRSNGCAGLNNQRCLKNRSQSPWFKLFKKQNGFREERIAPHPRMGFLSPY